MLIHEQTTKVPVETEGVPASVTETTTVPVAEKTAKVPVAETETQLPLDENSWTELVERIFNKYTEIPSGVTLFTTTAPPPHHHHS